MSEHIEARARILMVQYGLTKTTQQELADMLRKTEDYTLAKLIMAEAKRRRKQDANIAAQISSEK